MTVDKAKKLIALLQEVTTERGSSENEAKIAAMKIQDLLMKFHLELHDIEKTEENINREILKREVLKTGRLMWYQNFMAAIISKYLVVSVYKTRVGNQTVLMSMGFDEDNTSFEVLFNFLMNCMTTSFKRKNKNNSLDKNDYYKGFINAIGKCLEDNYKEHEEEYSLALVNPQLEEAKKDLNLKAGRSSGIKPKFQNNVRSYAEGYTDGNAAYSEFNNTNKSIEDSII